MIKAIETQYKGYRFRSRLEARWAVFFDALGIKWEYEKEGYELGELGWYLPDFWLPQVKSWAEVKPDKFSPIEFLRCSKLVSGDTHWGCIILDRSVPSNIPYFEVFKDSDNDISSYYGQKIGSQEWCMSWYANYERFRSNPFDGGGGSEVVCLTAYRLRENRFYRAPSGQSDSAWDDTEKACLAARSARFEHGESPFIK